MEKTLAQIADEHYAWIESVGWKGNRTTLENLGRIGSEIGELVNECRGDELGEAFPDEISDVILSTITAIKEVGIKSCFNSKTPINDLAEYNSRDLAIAEEISETILGKVSYGFLLVGEVIQKIENDKIEHAKSGAFLIITYFLALAHNLGININEAIDEKMAKNVIKGNRGRKK